MNNFLVGIIYSTLFLLLLILIEYVTRKKNLNKELTRKIAHILSGLFGIAIAFVLNKWIFITFAMIFFVIISISYGIKFFSSIHNVKRKTFGELFLPLGILAAYIFSNGATPNFVASVLILALSDPLAGVVGAITKRKLIFGSTSFFISSLVILLIVFTGTPFSLLILIAASITLVEGFSSFGTDNLTIPLVSSLLLKLLL